MLYKVIKRIDQDFPNKDFVPGEIKENIKAVTVRGIKVPVNMLIDQGFLEEIKETKKPKFKIGDYAVYETIYDSAPKYIKITCSQLNETCISVSYFYNGAYLERNLRVPTAYELGLYYR